MEANGDKGMNQPQDTRKVPNLWTTQPMSYLLYSYFVQNLPKEVIHMTLCTMDRNTNQTTQ